MVLSSRDRRFMALAHFMSGWSKDPRTQVGAVIVAPDPRKVSLGYNGFPPGIADDDRLLDRDLKNMMVQHAERNAMDNAQFDTTGATIYTTRAPCHACAGSLISKGIRRVVTPPWPTDPLWQKSSDLARSLLMEAGVEVTTVEEPCRP
jgi:dCMP deaminase